MQGRYCKQEDKGVVVDLSRRLFATRVAHYVQYG